MNPTRTLCKLPIGGSEITKEKRLKNRREGRKEERKKERPRMGILAKLASTLERNL